MMAYVDYYIFGDRKRIFKNMIYQQPAFLTLLLLIVNFIYPLFYSISRGDNMYHGGDWVWIQHAVIALFYAYMLYFVIKNRKKTSKHIVNIFSIFLMLPVAGMILQNFYATLYVSWPAMALSVMVIYIFLETTTGEKDFLTKLYSRQSYEKYIHQFIEIKKPFEILLIDLDNFKSINDQFGHLRGDQILIEFSDILRSVFNPNKIVCRLAGDEFMIVIENEINIDRIINKVYDELGKSKADDIRNLRFSYGCSRHQEGMTIDELYTSVDIKMYKNKKQHQAKML